MTVARSWLFVPGDSERKLAKSEGQQNFSALMEIIQDISKAGSGQLSDKQKDALADLQRAFRIK